jgi:anti-anti-sigma regulatory factor/CheY-specific phosphatase CheX
MEANILTLVAPNELDTKAVGGLLKSIEELKTEQYAVCIIDFSAVIFLQVSTYPLFAKIRNKLRALQIDFRIINASAEVRRQTKFGGVENLFYFHSDSPKGNLDQAGAMGIETQVGGHGSGAGPKASAAPRVPPKTLDVKIINSFIEAAVVTSSMAFKLNTIPAKPFLKTGDLFEGPGVFGIMSMESPNMKGMIRIAMPAKFVTQLTAKSLNRPEEAEVSDDALELIEEGISQLFLESRGRLTSLGVNLRQSMASAMVGQIHSDGNSSRDTTLVLPMDSELNRFFIEIVIC